MARLTATLLLALAGARAFAFASDENVVEALERAPAVVVGTFDSITPLAHSAHLGRLVVDETLVGREVEGVDVVWEEPGLSVPSRYTVGDRVLLGLAPLPTASIWKARVPDPEVRARLVSIAGAGRAAVARPSSAETEILRHHLALDPAARRGDAGRIRLAQLVAHAEPPLARAALAQLSRAAAAAPRPLPDGAAEALVQALLRLDAPGLPADLVRWIEVAQPPALARPLQSAIAAAGPAGAPIPLVAAQAALDGGLDPELTLELVRSGDEQARLIACRYARGDRARTLLPRLAASDPSARVRAEAVERWGDIGGEASLPETLRALGDPAVEVRSAAARAVAGVGPVALPELEAVIASGPPEAARMGIAALVAMGQPARPTLAAIAVESDDEALRTLAKLALGAPIGHTD